MRIAFEREQNTPECAIWYLHYFELKTMGAQQTQEALFTSLLTAWKNLDRGPVAGRELLPQIPFYI